MLQPRISSNIEYGQLLQAGLLIIAMVGVGLTIASGYTRLAEVSAKTDERVAAVASALAAFETSENLRVSADERRMDASDQERASFEAEQRASIAKVADAIADMRALVASGERERRR